MGKQQSWRRWLPINFFALTIGVACALAVLKLVKRLKQVGRSIKMSSHAFIDHQFDVVVVGAGGSGLRAALGCAERG